jgi:predicted lipoprotein
MDHEHILALVEAVHGAHCDAIHGLAANAAFVDNESQFSTPSTLERSTLAKKVVPYTQQSEPVLFAAVRSCTHKLTTVVQIQSYILPKLKVVLLG